MTTAERHITPRVVDHLKAGLSEVAAKRRPSFASAQCVLRHLARWARRDADGRWLATDTVGQIAAGTGFTDSTVRACLDALAVTGLALTVRRGGGHGVTARGSTRALYLDDATRRMTKTDEEDGVAGSAPRSWGGKPAELSTKTRGVDPGTSRGNPAEFTAPIPVPLERSRWADDSDVMTAPPPTDVTLAAIRAWRAGGPAPTPTPHAAPTPPAEPPADDVADRWARWRDG